MTTLPPSPTPRRATPSTSPPPTDATPAWNGVLRRELTDRLYAYAVLAVGGVLAGLAAGRPELVAIAAPGVLIIAFGLARAADVTLSATVRPHGDRVLEGETVDVSVTLDVDRRLIDLRVEPQPPAGLVFEGVVDEQDPAGGTPSLVVARLERGGPCTLRLRLRAGRWGVHPVGRMRLTATDWLGLVTHRADLALPVAARVYPDAPSLRRLLAPVETQLHAGNRVSRDRGSGIEHADVRALQPGDDARRINWRVTARRPGVWVSQRHPERNCDVILFVDTLAEARAGDAGTLRLAVRAAAGLAQAHLAHRDRVGLIGFGGALQWLRPGMGDVQRYRILDALLTSRVHATYVWTGVRAVPARALPAEALVIGLSPLLDERVVEAFADLHSRGFDLALVEVAPESFLPEVNSEAGRLARRWWSLERQETRARLLRSGVAVATWHPDEPFARPLEEVRRFRRALRHAS